MTVAVAFGFTVLLLRQYVQRRKIHQLLWMVAMLFYGLSALMEFLMNPDVMGASVAVFRIYYILAAPLVGLLGAGVVYLLARSIARYFLTFIIILSVGLVVTGLTAPLDESLIVQSFSGELGEAFRTASHAYPSYVRIFAIILNSVGGTVLIGGALYSYIRDRRRTYNLLLALGGLLPMIGGAALGFFQNPNVFFEFELAGTVFLFLGFLLSDRFIRAREEKMKFDDRNIIRK
jgi:uncharacterized membrane protein